MADSYEVNDVIAERQLELALSDQSRRPFFVRIGRPTTNAQSVWYCPVALEGLDGEDVTAAFGEDSLQALSLALQMAEVRIQAAAARAKATIVSPDEDEDDVSAAPLSDEEIARIRATFRPPL